MKKYTMVMAQQTAIFGMATILYGLAQGYRRAGPGLSRLLRFGRLEYMLILGTALMLSGCGLFAHVVTAWVQGGFGALDMLREIVAAMTLIVLGVQGFFGGFLLSIVVGNRARVETAAISHEIEDAGSQSSAPSAGPSDSARAIGRVGRRS